jgi:hypothetical protein
MNHELDRQFALLLESHRAWNQALSKLLLAAWSKHFTPSTESTHE